MTLSHVEKRRNYATWAQRKSLKRRDRNASILGRLAVVCDRISKEVPAPKEIEGWEIYRHRDALLKSMGFQSYAEYLDSETWRVVRAEFLKNNYRCTFCKQPAEQVHHAKYTAENLTGVSKDFLHAVCGHCHAAIEIEPDGSKRNPGDVERIRELLQGKIDKLNT